VLLLAVCAALAGCSEAKARRLSTQADALARQNKYEDAIGLLERLERDYPKTDAARGVRDRIVLYRGFLEANQKQDRRRAKDDLIAIGRALSTTTRRSGSIRGRSTSSRPIKRSPKSIPGDASTSTRPPRPHRYRLECLGEDGVREGMATTSTCAW
jgi:hypothetical protein